VKLPIHLAIKEAREHYHLSQQKLANRMEVPRTYVSKVENGKAVPTISSLMKFAKAMNLEGWRLLRCAEHWEEKKLRENGG
jgi:transcriptional regulator with XRE-family HTH domain